MCVSVSVLGRRCPLRGGVPTLLMFVFAYSWLNENASRFLADNCCCFSLALRPSAMKYAAAQVTHHRPWAAGSTLRVETEVERDYGLTVGVVATLLDTVWHNFAS